MTPYAMHGAIIFTKAFRTLLAWVSAYFAAKLFQDRYTQQVYIDRVAPSALTGFVTMFAMFQAACAVFSILILAGVAYILVGKNPIIAPLIMLAVLDVLGELVVGLCALYTIASVMQNKKYFNYKYEGLRAIRALRTIAFRVNMFTGITPYYMILMALGSRAPAANAGA
jgi:hypothetical protein